MITNELVNSLTQWELCLSSQGIFLYYIYFHMYMKQFCKTKKCFHGILLLFSKVSYTISLL